MGLIPRTALPPNPAKICPEKAAYRIAADVTEFKEVYELET
jgi:hypothetical protein